MPSVEKQQGGAPVYVSRVRAAEMLSVNVQTIDKLLREGRLPAFRVGRAVRIKLSDLNAALEAYTR
jgi:excisionase family DNA binding protein